MVLQGSIFLSTSQEIEENVAKSSAIDYRNLLYIFLLNIEAITDLIPIYLYLDKTSGWYHLQVAYLSQQHAFNFLLEYHHFKKAKSHYLSIVHLIDKQQLKVKSSLVDTNN